jgi:hypothetical protein
MYCIRDTCKHEDLVCDWETWLLPEGIYQDEVHCNKGDLVHNVVRAAVGTCQCRNDDLRKCACCDATVDISKRGKW